MKWTKEQKLSRRRAPWRKDSRRYRMYRRNGTRCLRISIVGAKATLAAWVEAGLLAEDQVDDDRAIERAIAQLCREGFRVVRERSAAGDKPAAGLRANSPIGTR